MMEIKSDFETHTNMFQCYFNYMTSLTTNNSKIGLIHSDVLRMFSKALNHFSKMPIDDQDKEKDRLIQKIYEYHTIQTELFNAINENFHEFILNIINFSAKNISGEVAHLFFEKYFEILMKNQSFGIFHKFTYEILMLLKGSKENSSIMKYSEICSFLNHEVSNPENLLEKRFHTNYKFYDFLNFCDQFLAKDHFSQLMINFKKIFEKNLQIEKDVNIVWLLDFSKMLIQKGNNEEALVFNEKVLNLVQRDNNCSADLKKKFQEIKKMIGKKNK